MTLLQLPLPNRTRALAPGIRYGRYPQLRGHDALPDLIEASRRQLQRLLAPGASAHLAAAERIRARIRDIGQDAEPAAMGRALRRHGLDADRREQALALAARAASHTLGLTAHPVQLAAAHALLCGAFVELATGEGKTLAIALAAGSAALAGTPVHVVTANDYLVRRDAADMSPLYKALGLRTDSVCEADGLGRRHDAYRADITYVTSRELTFDYLRDSVLMPFEPDPLTDAVRGFTDPSRAARRALQGLCMAIVDEADSVLIDEARLPLILARPDTASVDTRALTAALACARRLQHGLHFRRQDGDERIDLTEAGQAAAAALDGDPRLAAARLRQALTALHLYRRDRDYVVKDKQVRIVDIHSGRIADKRAWSRELHRFIELKEGCPLGTENRTAAQITYQRFFPRYLHLCGVSGTLRECAAELAAVYGRSTVTLPTHQPLRRIHSGARVFVSRDEMWDACVARATTLADTGRAVLIGTDSIRDSRALSAHFAAQGAAHQVLDALQDADEAAVVAAAGESARITISTRMAGRGTDIRLGGAVREAGGLHVINCQHNSTARTDRQLLGRCARQGDPGSAEDFRALDADGIDAWLPPKLIRLLRVALRRLPDWLPAALLRLAQTRHSIHDRRLRATMLRTEQDQHRRSAFRGPGL